MKKILVLIMLLITLFGYAAGNDAHTVTLLINPIAALGLYPGNNISLTIDDAGGTLTPGAIPADDTDNTQYLQYTIIKSSGAASVTITVTSAGSIPAGSKLYVLPSGGAGTPSATEIELTGSNTDELIAAIPNTATGTTAGDGTRLTYRYTVTNIALLIDNGAGDGILVTYTILEI